MSPGGRARFAADAPRVLLLIDQPGEAEVVLPLLNEVRNTKRINIELIVSSRFAGARPRMSRFLAERHSAIVATDWETLRSSLDRVDLAVSPVASSHRSHKFAHRLVREANARDIITLTMQHGVDNLGITRSADVQTGDLVTIDADIVCVWFAKDRTPIECPTDVLSRLAHVGRAAPRRASHPFGWRKPAIGVFENLHWERYDDGFRRNFQSLLRQTAAAFPDVQFIVKPHPSGRWLARRGEGAWPGNISLFDPEDDIARFDPGAILAGASGVITTPSTIALDAAALDKPVAIVSPDVEPLYKELPQLWDWQDWRGFVEACVAEEFSVADQRLFLDRCVCRSDAPKAICDVILASLR